MKSKIRGAKFALISTLFVILLTTQDKVFGGNGSREVDGDKVLKIHGQYRKPTSLPNRRGKKANYDFVPPRKHYKDKMSSDFPNY
jgi:hypothetical protein